MLSKLPPILCLDPAETQRNTNHPPPPPPKNKPWSQGLLLVGGQVTKAVRAFEALAEGEGLAAGTDAGLRWDALLHGVMGAAELAPRAALPQTGVSPDAEHNMSAVFVAPWDHPVRTALKPTFLRYGVGQRR